MCNILDIARYFLSINPNLTEKQLQKLVYYSYSWYIVKYNVRKDNIQEKLFYEAPEAWLHGPVFYTLYREMVKNNYKLPLTSSYKKLPKKIKEFLDTIYNVYGKYSGNELEAISCGEKPWLNARIGVEKEIKSMNMIKDIDIYEYYISE